jgi:hypothetical protein
MRVSPSGVTNIGASHTGSLPQTTHRVTRQHHILVRWTHWLNIPLLIGLIMSGMSIYWASPVYQHKPDPNTGNFDYLADIGIWLCTHVPGLSHYSDPPNWVYNHFSLGPGMLAPALALCLPLHVKRPVLSGGTRSWRRIPSVTTPPHRYSGRTANGALLRWPIPCKSSSSGLATS